MRPSLFKIGLIIAIIGAVSSGYLFYQSEKTSETLFLDVGQTKSVDLELEDAGIGFYKISVPELGDSVFVQVVDSHQNVLADKKIQTKTAVNYFDFEYSDVYSLKVTNLSEYAIPVEVEIGDTSVSEMRYSGIVVLVGSVIMVISGYQRLKNYKIAQPDENSS